MKIKKVIIPTAGFGTRMLPQTKAMPKEMLPLIDKPIVQYVVEEAIEAGIEDIILVTGYHKRSIEDHFDHAFELEYHLKKQKKIEYLDIVQKIPKMANFTYVRQKGKGYGNAIPIKSAKHLINKGEAFAILWGDIISIGGRLKQAINAFEKVESTVVCAQVYKQEKDYDRYGYISGEKVNDNLWKVDEFIEKPGIENKPSDLAVLNGYVLTYDIFDHIENLNIGTSGEICLIDAINQQAQNANVFAVELQGVEQYDTGNKYDYLKTVTEFALKNKDFGKIYKKYLKMRLD